LPQNSKEEFDFKPGEVLEFCPTHRFWDGGYLVVKVIKYDGIRHLGFRGEVLACSKKFQIRCGPVGNESRFNGDPSLWRRKLNGLQLAVRKAKELE
jgi:hypothetical protein